MRELVCIMCPKGCRLRVDESQDYAVAGQGCARGEAYGKAECMNPTRVVTSTVRISGALYRRCPVKTVAPIPKAMVRQVVRMLDGLSICAPVTVGQVVLTDACGTGIDIVTTRSMGTSDFYRETASS